MASNSRPWKGREQEMIQAYQQGVRTEEIVKQFGISRRTLYDLLSGAGIALRGKPESIKYDHAQVVADYLAGMPVEEIAQKHNMPFYQVIAPILRKAGIIQDRAGGIKPLSMKPWNPTFFERRDSEVAYWCGFLMADGSLKFKGGWGLSLSLHERDLDHLYAFCDAIGLDRSRVDGYESRYKATVSTMKNVTVYHPRLAEMLAPWGIVQRKTHNFVEPQVSLDLLPSYLLGWLDGDGHITTYKHNVNLGVTGNHQALEWYAQALRTLGYEGGMRVLHYEGDRYARLLISGRKQVQRIADLLNAQGSFHLRRKWDKIL